MNAVRKLFLGTEAYYGGLYRVGNVVYQTTDGLTIFQFRSLLPMVFAWLIQWILSIFPLSLVHVNAAWLGQATVIGMTYSQSFSSFSPSWHISQVSFNATYQNFFLFYLAQLSSILHVKQRYHPMLLLRCDTISAHVHSIPFVSSFPSKNGTTLSQSNFWLDSTA